MLAALCLLALAGRAWAANPSYLNIDVTITNTVSVSVGGLQTSTQSVTWSGATTLANVTTPVAVKNDSTYFASSWKFSTPTTSFDSTNGNAGWTIATPAGLETVAVQVALGPTGLGSCTGAVWTNMAVTPSLTNAAPITFTQSVLAETTQLGAGSAPDSGTLLNAQSQRQLCWQLTMPTSTSLTHAQVVPIVVTAF